MSGTTISVNGGEPFDLHDPDAPQKLADELGWTEGEQTEAFPETPEEKAARIRDALKNNVLDAQEAVTKAETKLVAARMTRKVAEGILAAYDELLEAMGAAAAVEHTETGAS